MKKYIYLDQNIYIHLLKTNQFSFAIEDLSQKLNNEYILLLSAINCYELSFLKADDHKRIINSLAKCEINYLPMAFQLQEEQLTQYIYKKYFNHEYKPLIICKYQSQMFTFIKPNPPIPLGGSLNDFIKIYSTKYLRNIKTFTEDSWLRAANQLYKNKDDIPIEKLTMQIFENRLSYFLSLLRGPSGNLINDALQNQIIDELNLEFEKDPKKWSALYIEDLFFAFRYRSNSRKPDKNDPRGIEHIICGLISCDFFITCDTNMLNFYEYANDKYAMPDCRNNLDFL